MLILVAYDIQTCHRAGQKRLLAVARYCESVGKRVQDSLFECMLDAAQLRTVESRLLELIDPEEDSVRINPLKNTGFHCVRCLGKTAPSYPDFLIH